MKLTYHLFITHHIINTILCRYLIEKLSEDFFVFDFLLLIEINRVDMFKYIALQFSIELQ